MHKFVLLCGPTCAGKTVGGEFIARRLRYRHVEASAIMRDLRQRDASGVNIDSFAAEVLREAPDRVPRAVLDSFGRTEIVLTGLRSPDEVDTICARADVPLILFVDALFDRRLERSIIRGRPGHPTSRQELARLDQLHRDMGLHAIADLSATVSIHNDGTIQEYTRVLEDVLIS